MTRIAKRLIKIMKLLIDEYYSENISGHEGAKTEVNLTVGRVSFPVRAIARAERAIRFFS